MDNPDRIEREITIDAPLERVWELVVEPGWWVGDGDVSGQRRWRDGHLEVVDDPRCGRFPVRVETVEPWRYLAYRWASGFPGEEPGEGNSTLVEFWLSSDDGRTVLRVAESGFAGIDASEEARGRAVEGNTEGWAQQLDILRDYATHVST